MSSARIPRPAYFDEKYLGKEIFILIQLPVDNTGQLRFAIDTVGMFEGSNSRIATFGECEEQGLELICSGFSQLFKSEFLEDFIESHRRTTFVEPYKTPRHLYEAFARMYAPQVLSK